MELSADLITEARAAIENAGRHDADELSPVAWFADFTLAPDPAAFAFSAMHGLRRFYPDSGAPGDD
jgi:hypothetical protein